MKIALIQTNPVIGDFGRNIATMTKWLAKARQQGCELTILPELSVSGYPPQDLLERPSFLRDHDASFDDFIGRTKGIGVLCGIIGTQPAATGKPLTNSSVLFEDGKILFTGHKRLLPTYDVFDEARYFEPGNTSVPFEYKGLRLGITICEDIWNDETLFPRQLYPADPMADLMNAAGGPPDLFINLSASPFHMHKPAQRFDIFTNLCTGQKRPLIYVNQVGGQDALIFDGRSLAMNSRGEIIVEAGMFEEDMVVLDTKDLLDPKKRGKGSLDDDETETLFKALVTGTRDYVQKCGFQSALLGLSGGIDSALTAVIASTALGPENVMGVALPSPYSSKESIEDAERLADNLHIRFEILPITDIFEKELAALAPLFTGMKPDVTEQNLQARIRGTLLMALSNKFGSLLLSTGNKSELAVGYCTLYGDMNGGLAVISDVPKEYVYKLARHINKDGEIIPLRTISKAPSAELAPNQKDQDDLPPYEVLDAILVAFLEENKSIGEMCALGFDKAIVEDVVRRVKRNEYKRKQAPLGLKVTTKAFCYGRRYPIVENYVENYQEGKQGSRVGDQGTG